MNLTINWGNPATLPSCGFKAKYHRNADTLYTVISTSEATSGTTSVSVAVGPPASYEGVVISDCCSGNLSEGAPWGINSYSPIQITIVVANEGGDNFYKFKVTSNYGNPYGTYIIGSFDVNISGGTNVLFEVFYSADVVESFISVVTSPPPPLGAGISNIQVTSLVPSFNGNSNIQQLDTINTPAYFQFYWESIPTWTGSPITLPSFTLISFLPTSQDIMGEITEGNLIVSWIQSSVYNAATPPNDIIIFTITDADSAIVGSAYSNTGVLGLNNIVIPMIKANRDFDTVFTMITKWGDNSVIASKTFRVPL